MQSKTGEHFKVLLPPPGPFKERDIDKRQCIDKKIVLRDVDEPGCSFDPPVSVILYSPPRASSSADIDDVGQSASLAIFIARFNTLLKITRWLSLSLSSVISSSCLLPGFAMEYTDSESWEGVATARGLRFLFAPIALPPRPLGQRPAVLSLSPFRREIETNRVAEVSKADGIKLLSLEPVRGRIMRHDDKNEPSCRA